MYVSRGLFSGSGGSSSGVGGGGGEASQHTLSAQKREEPREWPTLFCSRPSIEGKEGAWKCLTLLVALRDERGEFRGTCNPSTHLFENKK